MTDLTELEWMRLRVEAQIQLIDWASHELAGQKAPLVLELGLGNGRTYDHLRSRLPSARIMVFDRELKTKSTSRPPAECFVAGELAATLPAFARASPRAAELIHADLGNGDAANDRKLTAFLSEMLPGLLAPGGVVLTSTPIESPTLKLEDIPSLDPLSRYRVYRG